ncbi:MAG TPA: class I SAM-dependent methyltransferase [Acidimicrobiales bacterium]|nr:class I SAM-dependent methyltransferase [Acidimicrobiales bacterium]
MTTAAPAPPGAPIGLAPGVPREAAGQDAAKYGSTNPVVTRLLDRWTARMADIVGRVEGTVVDVGIGEGLCLDRLLTALDATGGRDPGACIAGIEYRFDKAAVASELKGVDVAVGDAGMLPFPDASADLVTCIEVLEHLPAVAPAVAELARAAKDRCIVSVPYEPWFRLGNLGRGKNIGRLGNDPEHLHMFTPRRLKRALECSFHEVTVTPVFPWLVADARAPRRS